MSNVIMQLEKESGKKTGQLNVIVPPIASSDASSTVEEIIGTDENKSPSSLPFDTNKSKWAIVKSANHRILPRQSRGEIQLSNIISELQKLAIQEQEASEVEKLLVTSSWKSIGLFRRRVGHFLQQPTFHYIVISLVLIDLLIVLVDLVLAQLSAPCLTDDEMEEYNTTEQRDSCLLEHSVHLARGELFLFYFSVILLTIFVLEVFISLYAFGWKYFKNPLYLLDGTIVFSSFIMEIYFHFGPIGKAGRAASALIVLRLWKIIRAVHAVAHSITMKNRLLIKKIQEAQRVLEEEKEQIEQTLEKQEIKLAYFIDILSIIGKLPTTSQIDTYVNNKWNQREKPI